MIPTIDIVPLLVALTGVAAAGWITLLLLAGASAALRHRVAVATLLSLLAVPAALRLPTVALPVLPGIASPSILAPAVDEPADPGAPGRMNTASAPAGALLPGGGFGFGVTGANDAHPWAPPLDPATTLVFSSLLISLILGARLLLAVAAARRVVRESIPVCDERLLVACEQASEELGIRRPLALRTAPALAIPAVYGWRRPTLLLPPAASEWSAARLRSVMIHELAHVARHDGLALLLGHVVTALFWFHPLAWLLARESRLASERACDDRVLERGVRASQYARDLVAITQGAEARRWLPGVATAFARRSALGTRLVAILEPGVRRGPVSRRMSTAIAIAAMLLVATLGSLRVVAATPPDASDEAAQFAYDAASTGATEASAREQSYLLEKKYSQKKSERAEAVQAFESDREAATYQLAQSRKDDRRAGEDAYDRAADLYDRERYAEAGPAFVRAASFRYRTATAYYNAACSFALAGREVEALDALAKSLDAGFDRPELIASDDDLDAIRERPEFRRLLERARNTDSAKAERDALVYDFNALRADRSADADEWRSAGIELLRAGDHDRALEAFEREFGIDSSAAALYNQACALSLDGRLPLALERLERSILTGFGDSDDLAKDDDLRALRGQRRFTELQMLTSDLELRIENDWFGRRVKPTSPARYERVAREHPKVGRAWFNLGYATLVNGDHARSAQAFEQALALGYRRATTMYNLGCVYAQLERPDDAFRWLERAAAAGLDVREHAEHDEDLEPLRSDPRFKRMRERWYSGKS
jgi:beta-lactamase regulating signal transducer with metallopeptidase domain/Tfp pilus assembly protein PilF